MHRVVSSDALPASDPSDPCVLTGRDATHVYASLLQSAGDNHSVVVLIVCSFSCLHVCTLQWESPLCCCPVDMCLQPQLAQKPSEHDRDMSHVVKSITYGDLWGGKDQKTAISSGPPSWLTTAYEGLVHFH
mmetsp:Transcript_51184/g.159890  ORF Transcript_51184/g.159890 Transcript_51184/m.159890 type:complete len:131 (+) Transcript_51184:137-529(+)